VHEDPAAARDYAMQILGQTYRQDFTSMAGKYLAVGDVDYCTGRVLDYIRAGATRVIFSSACPGSYLDRQLELLATQVVPAVRADLARPGTGGPRA
jgi:hypothetical protein